ncbi:MAG: HDIG domain-containing protein [Chitinivibrionia bacterium]|nr:HDIG domain-containing protein [Chitinivibrionia bacterium]
MKKNTEIYDFIYNIYENYEEVLEFLIPHVESVAKLAVKIAKNHKKADVDFVERAALLHDIGILKTHAPKIKCFGEAPYIQHGIFGKAILENNGFTRESIVAQTHIGVGITAKHIIKNNLPLPPIDMCPTTLEEKIVSYADLFYSKKPKYLTTPKTIEEVKASVKKYGEDSYEVFKKWHKKFGEDM